jgi:outer membrane biosynthesis protein TonB
MTATTLPKRTEPKLVHGLLASAALHALILALLAAVVVRVTTPVDVPLDVTWIRPVLPPPKPVEEPGGSGAPPQPTVVPKPVVPPKPRPAPVVKKAAPTRPPVVLHPTETVKAPTRPAPPPPARDTASGRIAENEYVDFSALAGMGGGRGAGVGHGKGSGIGDGVGSGIAPRRPMIYLARSMYQPDRADMMVYDRMFWHVVQHWDVPLSYKGRSDLLTTINVRFDKDGSILKFKFIRKSGDPAFDDTVVKAIVASNPLPAPTGEFYQRFYDSGIDFLIEPKDVYYYAWPDPYEKKKHRFGF